MNELRPLLFEMAAKLSGEERRILHRKPDWGSVWTLAFLTAPFAALGVWATTWDAWWRWPVMIFVALWLAVWLAVGVEKIWKPEDEAATSVESSSQKVLSPDA